MQLQLALKKVKIDKFLSSCQYLDAVSTVRRLNVPSFLARECKINVDSYCLFQSSDTFLIKA